MRFAFLRLCAIVPFALCTLHAEDVYVDMPGEGTCIKFLGSTHNCSGTDSDCMTNQQTWDADLQFGDNCGTYARYSNNIWLDRLTWSAEGSGGYDFAGAGNPDDYDCKTIGDCKVINFFGARICLSLEKTYTYVQWLSVNTDAPCPE